MGRHAEKSGEAPVTLAYGSGPDWVADLYVPAGEDPAAVAVVVHGGFWRTAFSRELMTPIARDLQRRGWFAWNIEYRRVGAGGGWPASADDVATAVARLAEIDLARIDLERVVSVGHSAGGHLALLAAARPSSRPATVEISGVVALAAVGDLELAGALDLGGGAVREFMGGAPDELPLAYAEASPRARLPLGVPHVHVHGYLDQRVPVGMTMELVAAARAAGDDASAILLEGIDHFALIDPASPAWHAAVGALDRLVA